MPDAPVDNSSDDTSSQAVNPLSGSVKIIYTGDDGLNVRKAPCILDKYGYVFDSTMRTGNHLLERIKDLLQEVVNRWQ